MVFGDISFLQDRVSPSVVLHQDSKSLMWYNILKLSTDNSTGIQSSTNNIDIL